MSSNDHTWSPDGVSLTLASWWTSRKRLFLTSWVAMVLVLVVSVVPLSMVLGGNLDDCYSGPIWHFEKWDAKCLALEPTFAVTQDQRAWQTRRVCSLGKGAPADLLVQDRDVFFDRIIALSGESCAGGWVELATTPTHAIKNRALVQVVEAYQGGACDEACAVYAEELARREWSRVYDLQYERMRQKISDWEAIPYVLRDGGAAMAIAFGVWTVLTLLWGLVWRRLRRPVRLHFGAHRVELDGKKILLESLQEARLDGNQVVFVVDGGEVRSRALATEVIVDLDSLLVQVRRQEGQEDPASIAAVQALLGSSTRA